MNPRLLAYLRSLGLSQESTTEQAWEFYSDLRGVQRSIANALNYNEADQQARTNCDLMIRSLGYNPESPAELLDHDSRNATETEEPEQTSQAVDTEALRPKRPRKSGNDRLASAS